MQTDFNIEVKAPEGVEVSDAEKEAYIKQIKIIQEEKLNGSR